MSRPGVTYEDVEREALSFLSQGIAPSVQRIRDVLGTGSHTTIAQHLRVWRQQYAPHQTQDTEQPLPKVLLNAVEALWDNALKEADAQFAKQRQSLDEEKAVMAQEKLSLAGSLETLKKQVQEIQKKLDDKQSIIERLKSDLALSWERLEQKDTVFKEMEKNYEAKHRETQKALSEKSQFLVTMEQSIEALKTKHDYKEQQYQAQIEKERERQAASESRWAYMIEQAQSESKDIKTQLTQKIEEKNKHITTLKKREKSQQQQLSELDKKYNQALINVETQLCEMSTYKSQNKELTVLNEELKKRIKQSKKAKEVIGQP